MNKHCQQCGKKIEGEKRGDSRFCSRECQNRFNYLNRKTQLNGGFKIAPDQPLKKEKTEQELGSTEPLDEPLKDHVEDAEVITDEEFRNSYKSPTVDSEMVNEIMGNDDFFGTSEQSDSLNDDETEQEYEQEESEEGINAPENVLPDKHIIKEIQTDNPVYKYFEGKVANSKSTLQKLEEEYHRLELELKSQQGRTGNELIALGGLGAGVFGFLHVPEKKEPKQKEGDMILKDPQGKPILRSKKNKWKKIPETKEPNFWERFGKALLLGAIGTGLGLATKGLTEDWREADKKQKIAAINKRMEEIQKEYSATTQWLKSSQLALGTTPKFLLTTKEEINPEYEKALNGLSEINEEIKNENEMKKDNKKKKRYKSDKIISAADIVKLKYDALNFKGLWREFFGLPALDFHLLVHGNAGEGKSTFCLWFARYLAEHHGSVLYVSAEEGINKTFQDKLNYCKAGLPDLKIIDVKTAEQFMEEINPNEFHFIFLDSIHDLGIDVKKMKAIFERYKNTAFICIDQNNKKGELLGANEKKHAVDILVNVINYTAQTDKNRYYPKDIKFKTADFQDLNKAKDIIAKAKKNGNNKGGYDLDSDRRGTV